MPNTFLQESSDVSDKRIFDWLQSCEVDPSLLLHSPLAQHCNAASSDSRILVRRLRSCSRTLPTTFMEDGDQPTGRGRGGRRTRSQARKNKLEASVDGKPTSPTKSPTKSQGQSSGTYQHAQTTFFPPSNTASSEPELADEVIIDQLQLEERPPTVTSQPGLRIPSMLSRSTSTGFSGNQQNSRSRSPTKRIGDLRAAKPPIRVEAVIKVPQGVRVILNRFMNIYNGIGVLPQCLKVISLLMIDLPGNGLQDAFSQTQLNALDLCEYPKIFFDKSGSLATAYDRELLEKLRLLREAGLRCQDLGKPEPSWGEEVFRPLLNLAAELENRDNDQKVQVENVYVFPAHFQATWISNSARQSRACQCYFTDTILSHSTTTQIFPRSLVPTGLQDLTFQSKRVDYCIYLSQTAEQEARTRDILTSRNVDIDDYSINQAGSADYVKWLPQLAVVECKKTLPGTDGMVQLGIWMAALRKRLERLMKQEMTKPKKHEVHLKPMPCLKVEGLDWKMYWCCIEEGGETVRLSYSL